MGGSGKWKGGTGEWKEGGGVGRGGPEYANTPRNGGGKGGWEGEDRSMQIPRGREYANTPWEIVMCRYSWRGCMAMGWGGGMSSRVGGGLLCLVGRGVHSPAVRKGEGWGGTGVDIT